MAKDLEQRFDAAMKKGESQDKEKRNFNKEAPLYGKGKKYEEAMSARPAKRSTSDGYMPRKKDIVSDTDRAKGMKEGNIRDEMIHMKKHLSAGEYKRKYQ